MSVGRCGVLVWAKAQPGMDQEVSEVGVPPLTIYEPLLPEGLSGSVGQEQFKISADSVANPGRSHWVVGGDEEATLLSTSSRCLGPPGCKQCLAGLSASLEDRFLYDCLGVATSEEV